MSPDTVANSTFEDTRIRPVFHPRWIAAALLQAAAMAGLALGMPELAFEGKATLAIFAATLIGWVVLRLPDTPVALVAVLALIAAGAVEEDALFETFESEIVWLLIAAFVMASVIRRSGIAERHALAVLSRCSSVASLFRWATLIVAATAFVIPSTSGRAAIFLPVFLAIAQAIGRERVTRALALLFPTVILLSACASLTGAGAHLIAVDYIDRAGGPEIGYLAWAALNAPFGLAISLAASAVIQRLFLTREDRQASPVAARIVAVPGSASDMRVGAIVAATVFLWATASWHGIDPALVALAGALAAASKTASGIPFKEAIRDVEWNLLVFLAATLVIGSALIETGVAAYLAGAVLDGLRAAPVAHPALPVALAALLSALAHLVVISRTARVAVLVPAVALPLSALGTDTATMILVVTVGSGFCQTLIVSAKPVMLFGGIESRPFSDSDLFRLALCLLPLFLVLLVLFATSIWPWLGLGA